MTNATTGSNGAAAPTADMIRCEQGSNRDLAGRRVGVMNVYDDDGMVAQVAIHDPATGKTEDVELRAGGEVSIGGQKFHVHQVVPAKGAERGAVLLVPGGAR